MARAAKGADVMEFQKLYAPSLKELFIKQLQGITLSEELPKGTHLPSEQELADQMHVSRAVVNSGLAELALAFQHEMTIIGGNSILPLIYSSFKMPCISLWVRFFSQYGVDALYNNMKRLYELLCERNLPGAAE